MNEGLGITLKEYIERRGMDYGTARLENQSQYRDSREDNKFKNKRWKKWEALKLRSRIALN